MGAVIFRQARDSEADLFRAVMGEHHDTLIGWEIGLLFRDSPRFTGGVPCFATAHLAPPPMRYLTGLDGWVEVCERYWDNRKEPWRRYLLDHELSHFAIRDGRLQLLPHDFEDFLGVLKRYPADVTRLWQLERATLPANARN
jgi:hypothetical protein